MDISYGDIFDSWFKLMVVIYLFFIASRLEVISKKK